jgi:hypothetical protein
MKSLIEKHTEVQGVGEITSTLFSYENYIMSMVSALNLTSIFNILT